MVDKYNESSQLRVRLAILESQLQIANDRIKQLESSDKDVNPRTRFSHQAGWFVQQDPHVAG